MLPDERLIKLPVLELWQLRANAATKGCKLSLAEIGRVLYHLNQKRGYKHAKADENNQKNIKIVSGIAIAIILVGVWMITNAMELYYYIVHNGLMELFF